MRTLILAYDNEGGIETRSINLFLVHHSSENAETMLQRVRAAFCEWYCTDAGKEYVKENGSNWGDAMVAFGESSAFRRMLRERGIRKLVGEEGGKRTIAFDEKALVDHNESLLG